MPRPRHCRFVTGQPRSDYFKPRGIPLRELEEARLSVEGLEALRLADMERLTAAEGARRMCISRHTFGRVLSEARKSVADALINGKALCIGGGTYAVLPETGDSAFRPDKPTERKAMTLIAVSSEGPTPDAMVDPRFGRAGGFVVFDPRTENFSYIDNGASQTKSQGAGIETAERLAEAGVGVVLSGYVGPKAFTALHAAGIRVCQDMDGMSVGEALAKFNSGGVPFAGAPNRN